RRHTRFKCDWSSDVCSSDLGIFKSIDGGTTWKPLTEGLPQVIQANLGISPSNPKVLYATVAGVVTGGGGRGGGGAPNVTTGQVGDRKSVGEGKREARWRWSR